MSLRPWEGGGISQVGSSQASQGWGVTVQCTPQLCLGAAPPAPERAAPAGVGGQTSPRMCPNKWTAVPRAASGDGASSPWDCLSIQEPAKGQ